MVGFGGWAASLVHEQHQQQAAADQLSQTYQLWSLVGADATSQGLVGGGETVTHWFDALIAGARAVAVTIEAAGGSDHRPPHHPMAVVRL